MTIQSVKLSNLSLSAINVRTASEETLEIESLAADIDARGVLVNLLVSPAGKSRGRFEVFDGGRRWRALSWTRIISPRAGESCRTTRP